MKKQGDFAGHPSSPQAFTVDTHKACFTLRARHNLLCVFVRGSNTIWKSSVGEVCYCAAVMYESI